MNFSLRSVFGTSNREDIHDSSYILNRLSFFVFVATLFLLGGHFFLEGNRALGILTFLGVVGACFAGGAAIGFLFGFPRAEKYRFDKASTAEHGTKDHNYSDNTNLEEISDWLTKIIVGLSLIKAHTIFTWIDQSAHSIASVYASKGTDHFLSFYVFGYSIIVFYFLVGAGLSYVWSRTNLSIIFSRSKEIQLQAEKEKLMTELQSMANNREGMSLQNADVEKSEKDQQFRNNVEKLYKDKPIHYKDDLQCERWGMKSQRNEKVLEAIPDYNYQSNTLTSIKLRVTCLDDKSFSGEVAFFLHDTFKPEIVYVKAKDGVAELSIVAWEAFVVGAKLDDGNEKVASKYNGTELELNLNEVKGFPDYFYWK